jgi:predicted GIY-YIG superfamily endonuclease
MKAFKKGSTRSNWSLYILECADGLYFTGMARNLVKEGLTSIDIPSNVFFEGHPERFPLKLVFQENNVPFKEALAKFRYMRKMNRKLKKKLIETKRWPMGGEWLAFLLENHKV